MASKSKGNRRIIILDCTEKPGTSRYSTMKNFRNNPDRIEMMKYNPTLRKHTLHREKR